MADTQYAHRLLDQLDPTQFEAVVHLLETIVDDREEDEMTAEDRQAITTSQEYFLKGSEGLTFEQVIADCGFTIDQFQRTGK